MLPVIWIPLVIICIIIFIRQKRKWTREYIIEPEREKRSGSINNRINLMNQEEIRKIKTEERKGQDEEKKRQETEKRKTIFDEPQTHTYETALKNEELKIRFK
jgi:hypothetical protein